jgi:hypothetical protein
MSKASTIADIEALIEHVDRELAALTGLIAEGRRLRAELVKELAARAWEEGGDPDIVRIVRNDP